MESASPAEADPMLDASAKIGRWVAYRYYGFYWDSDGALTYFSHERPPRRPVEPSSYT